MKTESEFWEKVSKSDDCWDWTGFRHPDGHGQCYLNGVPKYAHRFSWEMHNGPIPNGMCVCHKCDNPHCVNPDHLFLGTHEDNMYDAKAKGRLPFGMRHGMVALSDEDVLKIRSLYSDGVLSQGKLAKRFGVSQTCISKIVTRKRWTHLRDN